MKKVDLVYYPVGKGFLGSLTRAAASVRMYGKERVPREGGGVLAMNHFNFIDVPIFGTFCPRRIVFVGKSELFEIPGLSQLIRAARNVVDSARRVRPRCPPAHAGDRARERSARPLHRRHTPVERRAR